MAARKTKRKRHRSRGSFGFLYKALSIALILAALVVGCVVFFRVNTVVIAGNSRYTEQQILEAAEVTQGDNLFALDKFKISKQILTRLPYVASVSITRQLPDTLCIAITEGFGAAAIEGEGVWWVVNSGGKFVERTDSDGVTGLAPITGLTPVAPMVGTKLEVVGEGQAKLDALIKLMKAMDAQGMTVQAKRFDLTAANVILVGYTEQFTLKLYMSGTDYTKEMQAIQAAIERLPSDLVGTLDLTLGPDIHFIPDS